MWLFLIASSFIYPDHAIYISVIEISKNQEVTEIRVKVFQDDLQNAIKNYSGVVALTAPEVFPQKYSNEIESYFREHLKVNDLSYQLKSSELNGDSYWFTFLSENAEWTKINATADYLMELFPTQENILKVLLNGETRFCRLNIKNRSCEISY